MTWGKGSFLLLNVKWNTLSLTEKELTAFLNFFFFKPFKPCTHLTVTTRTCRREGVQTFQARVCFRLGWAGRAGIKKIKRGEWRGSPDTISYWQSEGIITFELEERCLLSHSSHKVRPGKWETLWYICKWGVTFLCNKTAEHSSS